jgi:serine/threonine-protein kinase
MGTVYAATQPGTSRVFALKVLDGGRNAKDFERFEREMNLTAQIDHPNVIRIFDYGRLPSGPVYYAMELIRGRTLAELVAQEPALPLTRVVRIMLHAARGLAAAHAVGVVHRDIKPENLMVSDTFGWPDFTRILDFGIARTLGHAASRAVTLTSGGIFLGTPRYAAPELILAGPLTPAADIYSFCCVLYVLLSGKGPFDGADTALAMLEAHVRDAPRPVALAAPRELPPALANLVDAGLAKAPEARPQDFHAVIAILSEVLSELEDADAPAAPHRVRRRTPSLEVAVMRPRDLTPAPQPTLVLPDATPAASAPISGSRPRPATPAQGELPAARGPEASRRKTPSRPADAAGEFRAVPQRLMTPLPLRSVARPPTPSAPIPAVVERPAGAAAGAVDAPRARDAEPAPPADARGGEGTAQATTGPASRERLYLGLLVLSLLALAALLALR